MDADRAARATAQIQPEQLFMETPPIVFDEWQSQSCGISCAVPWMTMKERSSRS